jgi:hypothetical protein
MLQRKALQRRPWAQPAQVPFGVVARPRRCLKVQAQAQADVLLRR